jgi:hypothetical protein
MRSKKSVISWACLGLGGLAFAGWLSTAGFSASSNGAIFDSEIAGPPSTETGVWRTKTQVLFDPVERTLVRRMYTVWDNAPSRDLDFVWVPDSPGDNRAGKINGAGRLIWRFKGRPAYDRASVFAEYRGMMKDGRADGRGTYFDVTGISYQGEWKNGLMEGAGTLKLSGGDEYVGQTHAGKAHGNGRYIDVSGEVFEGTFVAGQRNGVGTTTLPNGNSYRSTWVQGKETEDSRVLRVAQLGGQPSSGGSDDVRIAITIDRSKARDGDLVYAASSSGAKMMIRPDNQRLMTMWKGGGEIQLTEQEEGGEPEYGVFSLNAAQLIPLTLVLEVQNRSAAPVAVSGAYLAVQSSVSDLQPAIQINRGVTSCASLEYHPTFRAENFGWGAAQGAAMHFAFTNPNASARPRAFNVAKNLGDINQTVDVNLEPELRAAGVNTATLRAKSESGFVCQSKSLPTCFQQIKASGVFGSIAQQIGLKDNDMRVSALGTLDYTWQDSKGGQHTASSPYNLTVPLGHIKIEAECGEGGERDVIAANPLELRLDQSGYRIPVSFQRTIPAQQTSRFTVTLKAAKASDHDFTVVLQLANGREISSRPISLLYYVPRWFPGT